MSDYVKEVAMICLTLLCIIAMHYGYNGPVLVGVSGAIAGLGGVHLGIKAGKNGAMREEAPPTTLERKG